MGEIATVQGILARFLDKEPLDPQRRKVCGSLLACRTEALGGLKWQCDHCGTEVPRYRGCRDRHCPQCQGRATRLWSEQQQAHILPVTHYHLVFTLSHRLNGWVQLHPEVLYRILFQAAWGTLSQFGADPKRLGGQLGMTAVLHTWGQNLSQHVHLHCLVPGGALNRAGMWKAAKCNYLFPVKALSRHFKGQLVSRLRHSAEAGELERVTNCGEGDAMLDALMDEPSVIYTKDCLNHTRNVVSYLARYSHRIAITNNRILAVDEQQVILRYKDYRDHNQYKTMQLEGPEFVRRYLRHILPQGFMRIRHFGFMANRCRETRLKQIRHALSVAEQRKGETEPASVGQDIVYPCKQCRQGKLHLIGEILPMRMITGSPYH